MQETKPKYDNGIDLIWPSDRPDLRLLPSPESETYDDQPYLSPLQLRILDGCARGLTYKQIADEAGKSSSYISALASQGRCYSDGLFCILEASNQAQVMSRAIDLGFINPEDYISENQVQTLNSFPRRRKELFMACTDEENLGRTIKEIAFDMYIEKQTLKNHQKTSFSELGISGRTQAVLVRRLYDIKSEEDSRHDSLMETPGISQTIINMLHNYASEEEVNELGLRISNLSDLEREIF